MSYEDQVKSVFSEDFFTIKYATLTYYDAVVDDIIQIIAPLERVISFMLSRVSDKSFEALDLEYE